MWIDAGGGVRLYKVAVNARRDAYGGKFVCYVNEYDASHGHLYDPNLLADQALLVERVGHDGLIRILEKLGKL